MALALIKNLYSKKEQCVDAMKNKSLLLLHSLGEKVDDSLDKSPV